MPYYKKHKTKTKTKKCLYISYVENTGQAATRKPAAEFGATDWQSAKIIENIKRAEAAKNKNQGIYIDHTTYTFNELATKYLMAKKSQGKNITTLTYNAQALSAKFEDISLEQIKGQHIHDYTAYRRANGISDGTIIKELGFLSAAWNYAVTEWEWQLPPNPTTKRKPPSPPSKDFFLSQAQAKQLIIKARNLPKAAHLAPFIILSLNTAMRSGEALGLEWKNIIWERKQIKMVGYNIENTSRAKTSRTEWIPINAAALKALKELKKLQKNDSKWVFCHQRNIRSIKTGDRISSIKSSFQTAAKNANIQNISPHILRHTVASWLAMSGRPMQHIAQLLRQTTLQTTAKYAHLNDENKTETAAILNTIC